VYHTELRHSQQKKTSTPGGAGSGQKAKIADALCFSERPQATRTNLDFADFTLFDDRCRLDVHFKLTLGMPHRVADVVTKLGGLSADFTLCHRMSAS
jgi:hypothetical protein